MRRSEAIERLVRRSLGELTSEDRVRLVRSVWRTPAMPQPSEEMLVRAGLRLRWRGVRNEAIQEALGCEEDVEGEVERLAACPCCHYRTLGAAGRHELCPVCFWEDDGVRAPGEASTPNGLTLEEGRANFRRLGACSPASLSAIDPDGPRKYVYCPHTE